MSKIIIIFVAIWACSATVMAVKYRSAIVPQSEILSLKSEMTKLGVDNSRLSRDLTALRKQKWIETSSRQVAKNDEASQRKETNKPLSKDVWKQLDLKMSTSQDKAAINKYGALMKQLGMDPERQEIFLAALSEQGGPMNFMRLMRGGDADNKVLQKLLSADEYTAWQNYEKSMPVRESVQSFESNTGTELTVDQRERLVDIFQKNDYLSTRSVDVSDDASASRSIDRTYQALEPIMNEASAVLTLEQQQAMNKFLGEQVASQEQTAQVNSEASREAAQAYVNPAQDQEIVIRTSNGAVFKHKAVKTPNGAVFQMEGSVISTGDGAEQ